MFIEKKIFSEKECNEIIYIIKKEDDCFWNMEDRKYFSSQILYNSETSWVFDRLEVFFNEASNDKISRTKTKIHFHKFDTGGFFLKHHDAINKRVYSVGTILNQDYSGGEFKLYTEHGEVILNKTIGNSYIFDTSIYHEITPVTNGARFSMIWFLEGDNLKISKSKTI